MRKISIRHRNEWQMVLVMVCLIATLEFQIGGLLGLAGVVILPLFIRLFPTEDIPFAWLVDAWRGGVKLGDMRKMYAAAARHAKPVWKMTIRHGGDGKSMEILHGVEISSITLPETHIPTAQIVGKRDYVLMGYIDAPRKRRGGIRTRRVREQERVLQGAQS